MNEALHDDTIRDSEKQICDHVYSLKKTFFNIFVLDSLFLEI